MSLPDPVICFASSTYRQTQRFDLAESASLVLLDWMSSGRRESGEHRREPRIRRDGRESHCARRANGDGHEYGHEHGDRDLDAYGCGDRDGIRG